MKTLTLIEANLLSFLRTPSRVQTIFLAALWISLLPNLATLAHFAAAPDAGTGLHWLAFVLLGWLFIFAITTWLLVILGIFFWGRSIRWVCAAMIVVASVVGYYSYFLGTQFDREMFLNILQTYPSEVFELAGWRLLVWVTMVGVMPAIFLLTRPLSPSVRWWKTLGMSVCLAIVPFLMAIAMIGLNYQSFASAARNHAISFHTIAPANLIAAAISYEYKMRTSHLIRKAYALDAKVSYPLGKPRLVVLVLGETARAQNQALGGYSRDTNPRMRQENIVYFKDVQSCGTSTAMSVPCIFSGLTEDQFSLLDAARRETLVDTIRHAGNQVLWRDNDSGCKEVCGNAQLEDFTSSNDPKWCPESGNCFDEILLDGLAQRLNAMTGDIFLVLHLKGSHGPAYFKRYPKTFEKFKPTCQSNELFSCDVASIRNAYDNTILYTDHVLGELITVLKAQEHRFATAMLYVSDHGESLGENGLFLHGMPRAIAPKEQTQVPMLAWLSPQFIAMEHWSESCTHRQSTIPRSHDHVYHTVLGLLDIKTKVYKTDLDIFAKCDVDND
jgi:lipid A ethanolaminephosphotransferase